jgi:hypothetical protein
MNPLHLDLLHVAPDRKRLPHSRLNHVCGRDYDRYKDCGVGRSAIAAGARIAKRIAW